MSLRNRDVFKTITVTKAQLEKMVDAQKVFIDNFDTSKVDAVVFASKLTGFTATVLALIFFKNTAHGISAGMVSIVTTISSTMRNTHLDIAKDGRLQLLEAYYDITSKGGKSATMRVLYLEYFDGPTNATTLAFVQGVAIESIKY